MDTDSTRESNTKMWIQKLNSGAVLGAAVAVAVAGHDATAQPSLPPPPMAAPSVPTRNIDTDAARMTERYGLSSDQAAKVRTILGEQARKFDEVANQHLPPQDALDRLKSLRDEETSRVSAVLTPKQRKKYEQDARPALPAAPPSGTP